MLNSLPRLLEGMAASLHRHVLPAVDDDFARAQLRAVVELLGNLSTRVSWDPAYLRASVDDLRHALAIAAEDVPEALADGDVETLLAAPVTAAEVGSLAAARRDTLAAIARVQRWLGEHPGHERARDAVEAAVAADLGRELERLRTASFGRQQA